VLYVMIAFVVFVIVWFSLHRSVPVAANQAVSPAARAESADTGFEPDASNVAPTMQSQLEALRKRVVNQPEDTTHVIRLARLLQDAHKPEEAATYYRHYLALHPGNYQAWLDMTRCLGQSQLWSQAEKAVMDMLERYPDDPSALYNLGAVYANVSRNLEAHDIWSRIIEMDKNPEVTLLSQRSLTRLATE
jgi:tetratricopeptide (TPR) repeat protein